MKTLNFFLFFFIILFFSCNKGDDNSEPLSNCENNIAINENLFLEPSSSEYNIIDVVINKDCLEITFASSGCDGESWQTNLFSTQLITNGFNNYASLSLKLNNPESCEAYITKTQSFDLTEFRGEGVNIILNLENYNETVVYSY